MSNNSTPSSQESSTDSQKENGAIDEKEFNLCPFKLLWSFGINSKVPVINLTTANRTIIAYACSHVVLLYNYESQDVTNLQGHQNLVRTISVSSDGKWLLSADFEKDPVVVVWDTETGVPVCTLFNPHGEHELTAARISPNAKYLVTVGNEEIQKVHLWLWTYGKEEPNGIMELSKIASERVKDIAFNEDQPEDFILTADYVVAFCVWKKNELTCNYPQILGNARRYGSFNCSCYVTKTYRVVTATAHGYVLLWNVVGAESDKIIDVKRKHIKSVRLQKCNITVLLHHHGLIVIGTAEGRICFYDIDLKVLYTCQNPYLNCIRSISFELSTHLLGPVTIVSESELEFSEDDNIDYEGELEKISESKLDVFICEKRKEYLKRIQSINLDEVSSSMTFNLEPRLRNENQEILETFVVPTDATFESAPFCVSNFITSSANGSIALINILELKCQFIFQDLSEPITSLDAHPRSDFIVTGNAHGLMRLYDYKKRKLILRRENPPLPDFRVLLEDQVKRDTIIYSTCPEKDERLTAVTALKYSPSGDLIACGLENGALWLLHPITLDPRDYIPYKHSMGAINKLIFTDCSEYMAYIDNTSVVAVFSKNRQTSENHLYNFVGKYRVHEGIIRDLLFGPGTSLNDVPRLFSLGEDRNLIEYDLRNSGPYPDPGLVIADTHRIEYNATPLCLVWYPEVGVERFLMVSNSEYKYRLLNDVTKMNRGTFLGPLFSSPVRYLKELPAQELKGGGYMVFATDTVLGLQMYPIDGNPYKILGLTGHPHKLTNISVNCEGDILFTAGQNDPCVLMWKIKCKSVDALAHLGGKSLSPYYCLIHGGKKGWLINEMRDFFYYAQILHQGENTTFPRIISDKVSTDQIPNLMRAVGYYPTDKEIDTFMKEISYRNYANTGQLVEEITFEDFVKLYINHRPAFGISLRQLREAFQAFANPGLSDDEENPVLTREQFISILLGEGPDEIEKEKDQLFGEPLTPQEAFVYMKFLYNSSHYMEDMYRDKDRRSLSVEFSFLPQRISYKDFVTEILGIDLPEETRADDD